jgi:drug/metabolite transporter (DMT)-like permease
MSASVYALWILAAALSTTGQLSFKAAAGHAHAGEGLARWRHMLARPWIWLGIGCYALQTVAWVAFLSLVPLGRGLLMSSVDLVLILLAGRLLFDERLTRMRLLGIALVTLGVALVGAGP